MPLASLLEICMIIACDGHVSKSCLQVLERPYDERSDCWSMGCIILEMATTATHDANEIASILVQIKHSPQVIILYRLCSHIKCYII